MTDQRHKFISQGHGLAGLVSRSMALSVVRVLGAVATIGYTLLLARVTDADTLGQLLAAVSLAMLVSAVLTLNLEAGAIRFLPIYQKDARPDLVAGFVTLNRRVILALLPGAVVMTLALLWLREASPALWWMTVFMIAGAAPLLAFARATARHATALDAPLRGAVPNILVRPALFGLAILAGYALGLSLSGPILAAMFVLAATLTVVAQLVCLGPCLSRATKTEPSVARWRDWLALAGATSPAILTGEYLKNLALISAAVPLIASETAVFGIALSLMGLIDFGVKAVDITVSPRVSSAMAQDDYATARQILGLAALIKLCGFALACIVLALTLAPLISLLGSEYAALSTVLPPLLLVPLARLAFGPAPLVLNITGQKRASFSVSLIGVVVIAGGSALGAMIGGMAGAAQGVGLSFAVYQAIACRAAARLGGLDTSLLNIMSLRR